MTDNPSTREFVLRAMEAASIHPMLKVVSGPHTGATLTLEREGHLYAVGRSRAGELALEDDGDVSRQHLEVRVDQGKVSVRDLRTRHGTRLAGHRLQPGRSARWTYGAVAQVGGSEIELIAPAAYLAEELVRANDATAAASEAASPSAGDAPPPIATEELPDLTPEIVPDAPPAPQRGAGSPAEMRPPRDRGSHVRKSIVVAASVLLVITLAAIIALISTFR